MPFTPVGQWRKGEDDHYYKNICQHFKNVNFNCFTNLLIPKIHELMMYDTSTPARAVR